MKVAAGRLKIDTFNDDDDVKKKMLIGMTIVLNVARMGTRW